MKRVRLWWTFVLIVAAIGLTGARSVSQQYMLAGGVLLELDARLPAAPDHTSSLRVAEERWTAGTVADTLGSAVVGTSTTETKTAGGWTHLEDGTLVRIGDAGTGFYATKPAREAGRGSRSVTASEAVEIARAYVVRSGGLPPDAVLWGVREVRSVGLSLDSDDDVDTAAEHASVEARYVEYRHGYGGMPIDSPDGADAIKVRVSDDGAVSAYGRTWRTVLGVTEDARRPCRPAREALGIALKARARGAGKSDLGSRARLVDAQLVWLSASRDCSVRELSQAWRFVIESGQARHRIFADAATGAPIVAEE